MNKSNYKILSILIIVLLGIFGCLLINKRLESKPFNIEKNLSSKDYEILTFEKNVAYGQIPNDSLNQDEVTGTLEILLPTTNLTTDGWDKDILFSAIVVYEKTQGTYKVKVLKDYAFSYIDAGASYLIKYSDKLEAGELAYLEDGYINMYLEIVNHNKKNTETYMLDKSYCLDGDVNQKDKHEKGYNVIENESISPESPFKDVFEKTELNDGRYVQLLSQNRGCFIMTNRTYESREELLDEGELKGILRIILSNENDSSQKDDILWTGLVKLKYDEKHKICIDAPYADYMSGENCFRRLSELNGDGMSLGTETIKISQSMCSTDIVNLGEGKVHFKLYDVLTDKDGKATSSYFETTLDLNAIMNQ